MQEVSNFKHRKECNMKRTCKISKMRRSSAFVRSKWMNFTPGNVNTRDKSAQKWRKQSIPSYSFLLFAWIAAHVPNSRAIWRMHARRRQEGWGACKGRPDKTLEIVAGIHRLLKEEKGAKGGGREGVRGEDGTASQNAERKRAALPSMH